MAVAPGYDSGLDAVGASSSKGGDTAHTPAVSAAAGEECRASEIYEEAVFAAALDAGASDAASLEDAPFAQDVAAAGSGPEGISLDDPPYRQLPPEVALAASALCEATDDDAKAGELMQRYWGLDERTATRAVAEARGRLLLVGGGASLGFGDFIKRGEYSLESIESYVGSYVEENADVIRTGVKGGGIKFVVSNVLKALYTIFQKYIVVFIEPILAMLAKLFPFFPFI